MTAVEYVEHCLLFEQFGKIQDINFDLMLHNEPLHDGKVIRGICFDLNQVEVGELIDFGCECCGSYYETEVFDLDEMAMKGYLGELIDKMEAVLDKKTGI